MKAVVQRCTENLTVLKLLKCSNGFTKLLAKWLKPTCEKVYFY